MDFSQLSPVSPAPEASESAVFLEGPGSVDVDRLRDALSRTITRETRIGEDVAALVVSTSGSTGRPKRTVLSAGALRASGLATETATGTDGGAHWLLALPVHYVAGAQVVARSVLAATRPAVTASVQDGGRFTARDFLDAANRLPSGHRMTSLVPTQLHTLMEDAEADAATLGNEILEALRSFDAILLGGAPASAALLGHCEELGIPLVLTYGSAETAGGCVYDNRPLPGTRVAVEPGTDPSAPGRIWLGGSTVASGYLGDPERTASSFRRSPDGTWWYRTDDLGTFSDHDGLSVAGRTDDVILTGGIKVSARAVAAVLEQDPSVREAVVVGVESPRWGQEVRAAVSRRPRREPDVTSLVDRVRQDLGRAAAPKTIRVLDRLPQTSTGKPDRAEVHRLLAPDDVK
ncbi:MAG: AMP-binding protein [Kocuria sp.]|nr:AMP-binding protein [Kocuria sp.]